MLRRLAWCIALLAAVPAAVHAQDKMTVGVRLGVHEITETGSAGAELTIPLVRRLAVVLSADLFFIEYGSYRAYNLDLKYSIWPALYLGGGVTSRWLSAGDAHGDVLGGEVFIGVELPHEAVRPFAEARAFVKDGTHGSGLVGIRVTL